MPAGLVVHVQPFVEVSGGGGEAVEGARGGSENAFVPLPGRIYGESLAAQIKEPQDRMEVVRPALEAAGASIVAADYPFGEYDVLVVYEASDDTVAAALAQAIGAGGSVKSAQTAGMLSGREWVESLRKAEFVSAQYRPAR